MREDACGRRPPGENGMPTAWLRRRALVLALAAAPLMAAPGVAADGFRSAVVALALWSDPVFRSEATGAAAVLAGRYGHGGPVIVRANTARALVNGPDGIRRALAVARRGMDPAHDVLFLVLTSHGAPDGIAERGGGREGLVPPAAIGALLAESPFRRKVLIVSACFAGTYTALAGPGTLVITAADATHASFGCQPEARWTYFGDALFNQALRHDASLAQAFGEARSIVAAREAAQGFAPSNPQMVGGDDVLTLLDTAP